MEAPKEFGKVVISLENSILPLEVLENTPSRKDGISESLETDLRMVGCDYIQSAGILLKLPQVAMATAQVLFHRFYYAKSFMKYNVQYMAAACIFTATKVEEAPRRLRDVINVFHHLKQKWSGRPIVPMEFAGSSYFSVKNSIIKYERYLLKELGFCVHVKHPHKMIMSILKVLGKSEQELVQKSWNLINDSLRTSVLVKYHPEVVACGCIFLAARTLEVSLPESPGWWEMFDATYDELEDIALDVLEMYSRPKRNLEEVEKELSTLKDALQTSTTKEAELKKSVSIPASTETSPKMSPKASPVGGKDAGSDGMSSAPEDDSRKPLLKVQPRTTSRGPSPLVTHSSLRESTKGNHSRERSPSLSKSSSSSSDERYHPVISPIRVSPDERERRKPEDRQHNGRIHRDDRDSRRSKHHSRYHHRERRHNRSRSRSRDRSRRHRVH